MNAVLSKKPIPATAPTFFSGTTGTSNGTVTFTGSGGANAGTSTGPHSAKSVEAAVFAYLQARRALGVVQINSIEIAGALGLVQSIVELALHKLSSRGVKVK
jgi:hypothetical protein